MLTKVVIAGGVSILKCLIKVFNELKYNIHKYKSDKNEDIKKLTPLTSDEAIELVKITIPKDIWQTLFFVAPAKKAPTAKASEKASEKAPKKASTAKASKKALKKAPTI